MSSFMLKIATRAVETDTNGGHTPAPVPRVGLVINALLSMVTIAVLAVCLSRRIASTRDFSTIPITRWLIFAIYIDSIIFIVATNILADGFGVNLNKEICASTIILCLTCYLSTKLIYYFLVEKVYIIRNVKTSRLKSKLYLFNCFGMLLPYCVVVALNYVYRISYLRSDGVCIIGMQKKSMMPLIIFDAVVNLYLTMLFVIPIRKLYTYKNSPDSPLKTIAIRSFFGALATLTSAVVNLTVLMVLKGEPAWVCLMCCNADVLFSVIVLHWVTSKDSASTASSKGTNSKDITGGKGVSMGREAYGLGSRIQPTVTTHISAAKTADGADLKQSTSLSDDEMERGIHQSQRRERSDRMDWARNKRGDTKDASEFGEKGYPMGKIRVQVGQVVEIESECNSRDGQSERSLSSPRAETMGGNVVLGHRAGKSSSQSTEDLVPGGRI